jgi:hypothetical protein
VSLAGFCVHCSCRGPCRDLFNKRNSLNAQALALGLASAPSSGPLRHPTGETHRRRSSRLQHFNQYRAYGTCRLGSGANTLVGKHMAQTPSTASSTGGTYSAPLVPAVTTIPIGATPATGTPVSTFCVEKPPVEIPHPTNACWQTPTWLEVIFPLSNLNGATS